MPVYGRPVLGHTHLSLMAVAQDSLGVEPHEGVSLLAYEAMCTINALPPVATSAPRFTPKHWLLCHMGLYKFEFEFATSGV